jgi:hypothetical protein
MYAALGTRPDISFAVTSLSRHNETPLMTHLTAAKRVLKYLKKTADIRLFFPIKTSTTKATFKLQGFTDSDWGGIELIENPLEALYSPITRLQSHGKPEVNQ